ncbi:MAG: 6-phosphofructokinase [Deltaproteobacteria bacterium]|nr:6-phosphofructokinase [Deltaproteobacteria bacterium]
MPNNLSVFVSHCIDDKKFVFEVCDLLTPYLSRKQMFLFEQRPTLEGHFLARIDKELKKAQLVLIFVGKRFDDYMKYEAMRTSTLRNKLVCMIDIGEYRDVTRLPKTIQDLLPGRHVIWDKFTNRKPQDSVGCARKIIETLGDSKHKALAGRRWTWSDKHLRFGLPTSPHVFDYEKEIIKFYLAKRCREILEQAPAGAEAKGIAQRYASILDEWPPDRIKETLEKGISAAWPDVYRYPADLPNPLPQGAFKDKAGESYVRAAALVGLDPPDQPLRLPEAGPRKKVCLPTPEKQLKVAIVVSGGIAPGINAVIDAIVQRHNAYHVAAFKDNEPTYSLKVIGLKNGLLAVREQGGLDGHSRELIPSDTVESATRGGSMLGTSRDDDLLDLNTRAGRLADIADRLRRHDIDVLYIIGGDGSMKAAHALWHRASTPSREESPRRMSVVAIPKTMDNDILWVWQSFGFLSAVEEAREIVERMYTEVRSNPRLGIVQFFGSGSGFVVSHAVLASAKGHTTLALIPELDFSVLGVACYVKRRMWEAADKAPQAGPAAPVDPAIPHGLIVMAETAIPVDALECLGLKDPPKNLRPDIRQLYVDLFKDPRDGKPRIQPSKDEREALDEFIKNGRRVQGQTNDHLRNLAVKLLLEALPILIKEPRLDTLIPKPPGCRPPVWGKLRMVRNEPRYLVRALEPSTSDIINGQRLGLLAVDAAMAGFTDCMISQWLTEFTLVPLDLVVLGRKRIPPTGMFWDSVTEKTRQPPDLVAPYPNP